MKTNRVPPRNQGPFTLLFCRKFFLLVASPLLFHPAWSQAQEPKSQITESESVTLSGSVLPPPGHTQVPRITTVSVALFPGDQRQIRLVPPEGRFEFGDLPAGQYKITLRCPGFETVEKWIILPQESLLLLTVGKPIERRNDLLPQPQNKTVSITEFLVPPEALKLLTRANQESERNRPEEAIQYLEQALRIHPDFYQAYNNLGVQYLRLGDRVKAVEALEQSIHLNSQNPLAHRNLGAIRLGDKDYQAAVVSLRRSLELDSGDAKTLLALGDSYLGLGQNELALPLFQKLAASNPSDPVAYLKIGTCFARLQRFAEAIQQFERFLQLTTDSKMRDRVARVITELRSKVGQPF